MISPDRKDTDLELIREMAGLIASGFRAFVTDPARETRHGPTPPQLRILQLVDLQSDISLGEAAASLGITSASASTAFARLSALGWLTKRQDPEDGRGVRFRLSAKGKRVFGSFEKLQKERIGALVEQFDPEEIAMFRSLVQRVTARIEDMYG